MNSKKKAWAIWGTNYFDDLRTYSTGVDNEVRTEGAKPHTACAELELMPTLAAAGRVETRIAARTPNAFCRITP